VKKKDALEGTLINGRYRVLRRLGQGGMGMVYLAKVEGPAGFEKLVALKVVHSHVAHDAQVIEMFLSEARLSAQLNHANIAQIYELGESGGLHYLAMEYVRGRDLRALMRAVDEKEGRIPLPLCVFIVSKLCEALDHAHELRDKNGQPLKLVHRDATPVNCLLGYSGEVKLIDFGIAKASNVASSTRAGMIRGKLAYMSPEQTWGHALDKRSDVFALGVILFELLIGARPFDLDDDNEMKMIDRIRSGDHPRAGELDPELPAELDRIVEKALTVSREKRYQSAGAMYDDLQRFLMTQQLHVTAKDLGAFLVEMVGVEAAKDDGAAPAELTAQTSLKRTPEGKSELRSRVITQPDRDRVQIAADETKDHVSAKDQAPTRIAAMPTESDLHPVDGTVIVSGMTSATERVPSVTDRPRKSNPISPTVGERPSVPRPPDRVPTENVPASAVRRENEGQMKTMPGAPARSLATPGATLVPTEPVPEDLLRRAEERQRRIAEAKQASGQTLLDEGPEEAAADDGLDVLPRRRPTALIVALLLGVAVLGGGLGWWWTRTPADEPTRPPRTTQKEPPTVTPDVPVDAGAVAVVTPVEPTPVEPEPTPVEPTPPEPAAAHDAGLATPRPSTTKKPVAVADKRPTPVKPPPVEAPVPPKLPVVNAFITVRANQRSEVVVDGKLIGETPRLRIPVSPGRHTLRVDCVYAWGKQPGKTKDLDLPAWAEAEVQHECVEKKP
jgi:serine/threonine-protein kinase